ncbi:obscurin-like [Bacillus rossius redtenbacheri]|uniref:obscurin-like n=1 Tax=Bacillus rossius redtenbacheri TaxID=93214 RepID=UPI002FDEE57D
MASRDAAFTTAEYGRSIVAPLLIAKTSQHTNLAELLKDETQKNGQIFDPEERFKVIFKDEDDSLALFFQHIRPSDGGVYTFVASTACGKILCNTELVVSGALDHLRKPEPPIVTVDTRPTEVSLGDTAVFELRVQGHPRPDIKWLKNGKEIQTGGRIRSVREGDDSISLIVREVAAEDAGKYTVVVSNRAGESSTQFDLLITAPPKIKTKIEDSSVKIGETYKVTAEVEGIPTPEVKWYKNGKQVVSSSRVKVKQESAGVYTLTVSDAQLEDSGAYLLVAAAGDAAQTSQFWRFTVLSPPQFLKTLRKAVDLREDDSLVLEVKVEGDPKPEIKWVKDGREVTADGKRVTVSDDGHTHTLTLCKVSRRDMGLYSCEAWNDHGWTKDESQVNVRCAPEILRDLRDLTAGEGDAGVELSVAVAGYPKPIVKWYLNDNEIRDKSGDFEMSEEGGAHTLTLRNVTTDAAGKYTAKAVSDQGTNESSCSLTVNYKPRFQKPEKDRVEADEGQTLTLTFLCSAEPQPEVKWYKDGQELKEGGSVKTRRDGETCTLEVAQVKGRDSGEYEARAVNAMGTASAKTCVQINTCPEILSSDMEDRMIYESLGTTYEVKATGVPRPEAKWFKDGEPLKSLDHVKLCDSGDNYRLELKDATLADAGVYKCVVANRLGEKSQEAKLSLSPVQGFRGPVVKAEPKDVSAPKNGEVVMTCVIVGDPVPEVKWFHDGVELKPSERLVFSTDVKELENGLKECTYAMRIASGQHGDTGVYKVAATNKHGCNETEARLDVLLVPEISELKDAMRIPHESLELEVVILANPRPQVVWTRDGKQLSDGEHTAVSEDPVREVYGLAIRDVAPEDDGLYVVTARNSRGETSRQARLTVHSEMPSLVKKLENQVVKAYDDAEFMVRSNGVPRPQIKWFKDGRELRTGDRITIEAGSEVLESSHLLIKHFQESDEGKYTVETSNIVGKAESSAKLTLAQIPPSFGRAFDRVVDLEEGDALDLKMKLDGSPVPTVKWCKDGVELQASDRVRITTLPDGTTRLQIEGVTPEDQGIYSLTASNRNGHLQTKCSVSIKSDPRKPQFVQALEDVTLVAGESLRLSAQVKGFPAPEIKWFKDGRPLLSSPTVEMATLPGGMAALHVARARLDDAGRYSLTASNKMGTVSCEASVALETRERKPVFLQQLIPYSAVEGFPVKLEVKAVGNPRPTLSWTYNGKPFAPDGHNISLSEQPDGTTSFVIAEARPEHAGEYEVTATNEKGSETSRGRLKVLAKQLDSPEKKPEFVSGMKDVAADEGTTLTFETTFEGNPIPDVIWKQDGQPRVLSDRVLLTCDGQKMGLQIKPVRMSDDGTYSCQLKNPLGSVQSSAKATVRKVYQAPKFVQSFTDIQQLPNLDAKFLARIVANPQADVTWYLNGEPIKQSAKYEIKRTGDAYYLHVKDCTPSDSGKYKCEAANFEGVATCEANLTVVQKIEEEVKAEPPEFLKRVRDCDVYEGMTAKFTACVSGAPDPGAEWSRGGVPLVPGGRVRLEDEGAGLLRLTVEKVEPADAGRYKLRIFNQHGEASCEAELVCESRRTVQEPANQGTVKRSLSWRPPSVYSGTHSMRAYSPYSPKYSSVKSRYSHM